MSEEPMIAHAIYTLYLVMITSFSKTTICGGVFMNKDNAEAFVRGLKHHMPNEYTITIDTNNVAVDFIISAAT